jgi:glycosyltransferase involved in cell wall biosynthesis
MRICIVYDCLFPWTVGGAERWYLALAEAFAAEGHAVTYLTLRQWDEGDAPAIPGVAVMPVGPRLALYAGGTRRIWPPLRFGLGVALHLLRHGRRYDHVHCASFPFFALLAIGLLRPFGTYRIGVDWHEVWTRAYWREYLGRLGSIGWAVQWLCAQVPARAFTFSRLHGARLAALGREPALLSGEYAGGPREQAAAGTPPTLVYAGRLIPEKRVELLVEAFALAQHRRPELRLEIYGDGPERARLAVRIATEGLGESARLMGFVTEAELDRAMREATALVQPSAREGYGMVVVEAAVRGVPAILVQSPDNAAVELIEPGINGLVAAADAAALAEAIEAVIGDAEAYRASTRRWYDGNAERLSLAHSLDMVRASLAA